MYMHGITHVYLHKGAMDLRGIPPIATFSMERMDKPVSLEVTFERLDMNKNIKGMWDLITSPSHTFTWSDGVVTGWIPANNAAALAWHVKMSPTGWFKSIGDLDESFAHLIKLVGKHVKIIGLKNKTEYNGKSAKKFDVFVKNGQLGICVTLDDGRSLMVKPANIVPKVIGDEDA